MISFKPLFDLMEARNKSIYHLRRDKVMGSATLDNMRLGTKGITTETINAICEYLGVQPGEIMEYVPDATDQSVDA